MHEWGITEEVIKEILKQAKENGLEKIDKVCLSIGEDSGITADSLEFCFQNLSKGTILETIKLKLDKCKGRGVVIKSIEGQKWELSRP